MILRRYLSIILSLVSVPFLFSQEDFVYKASTIPPDLLKNANAVVRYDKTDIIINDFDDVNIVQKRIVTILSEKGLADMGTTLGYDSNRKIRSVEAKIFNSHGKEIDKFKKNDFQDVSAVPGGTLYSDNRVIYLRYTPKDYPFTIEFQAERDLISTSFLPNWFPLEGYFCSTEFSEYRIINNSNIKIKVKESNLKDYYIQKISDFHFKAENLSALIWEAYGPRTEEILPMVKIAMTDFNMEGVRGINNNWSDFGKWMNDYLLEGTDDLPPETIIEIKGLTSHVDDPVEKAKIVYKYVQDKTRYVSVQIGIGGWKPMLASDVERLRYSDCKGLTNYTKSLLNAIGIEANYAVIYGDNDIKNFDNEFSLTEGNHAVLNIETPTDNIWLECTSQTSPFGFVAGFTDDRDALVITPEGGKIVHTTIYELDDNLRSSEALIHLSEEGKIEAELTINSHGYIYGKRRQIQFLSESDKHLKIKEELKDISGLELISYDIEDDKNQIQQIENLKIMAVKYARRAGDYLIFNINPFNKLDDLPIRYPNRQLDLDIDRSIKEIDKYIFDLPDGSNIEDLPEPQVVKSKFGHYTAQVELMEKNKIVLHRTFEMYKGLYNSTEYEDFRSFMSSVYKIDNTKIALKLE